MPKSGDTPSERPARASKARASKASTAANPEEAAPVVAIAPPVSAIAEDLDEEVDVAAASLAEDGDEQIDDAEMEDEDEDLEEDLEDLDVEYLAETSVIDEPEGASAVTLRLSADLRRRLRRRAEREGVTTELLAEELLGAALRRTASDGLGEVVARLERLEKRFNELSAPARQRDAAPEGGFAPRRDDRPWRDAPREGGFNRPPAERGGFERRFEGSPERPPARPFQSGGSSFGGGNNFQDRRPEFRPSRPSYGDRPFDRGGDRPRPRSFDRDDSRGRPPRRWEGPRREG